MGKIMMNGKQYGVGGITDASDVKYTSSQTVKGALDEVKSGLNNLMGVDTVTVTTSASGSAMLLQNPGAKRVISAASTSADYVVIPVLTGAATEWVKVFNWNMQPIANTEVTIRYYYINSNV